MRVDPLRKSRAVSCGPRVEDVHLPGAVRVGTLRDPSPFKRLDDAFKQSHKLRHHAEVELGVRHAGLEEARPDQEPHPEATGLRVLLDKLGALGADMEGVGEVRDVHDHVDAERDEIVRVCP